MARQHYQRLSPADIDKLEAIAYRSFGADRAFPRAADEHGADLPDSVWRHQT